MRALFSEPLPASESCCASYVALPCPESQQHYSTSSFQTIDLAHHVIPTQQASTAPQRPGSPPGRPTASSHIQSQEVSRVSPCSQFKQVHLSAACDTHVLFQHRKPHPSVQNLLLMYFQELEPFKKNNKKQNKKKSHT